MDRYLQDIPTGTLPVETFGQYWNIANRDGNGWTPPSPRYPLGLHFEKTGENAQLAVGRPIEPRP